MVDVDMGAKPVEACSGTVNQKLFRYVAVSQRGLTDSKLSTCILENRLCCNFFRFRLRIVSLHEPKILKVPLVNQGLCAPICVTLLVPLY